MVVDLIWYSKSYEYSQGVLGYVRFLPDMIFNVYRFSPKNDVKNVTNFITRANVINY